MTLHLSPHGQDAADRLRHRRAAHQHQQRLRAQLEREAALQDRAGLSDLPGGRAGARDGVDVEPWLPWPLDREGVLMLLKILLLAILVVLLSVALGLD